MRSIKSYALSLLFVSLAVASLTLDVRVHHGDSAVYAQTSCTQEPQRVPYRIHPVQRFTTTWTWGSCRRALAVQHQLNKSPML